ncbi:ImmA/IrrE family metallo-endopeptidase [Arthrobacter cryoconiti]|uniref:ImmA/IrrE family metallo-endopeptidase n=1 Tax=Arthrobacter cryoconiti TaxID=748907 RepID=A0ABV8QZX9_9MICC|nr:ImmA/IrrE family metallo-endopeptidase [Arthrobacter cryoconiti]MCC9068852.1 ImmA/IrrE family metallo-endopeptidase [Arthrobacter cryoconiti]
MDIDMLVGDLGVTVDTGPLPKGWWGAYDRTGHAIILRHGLAPIQRKSTLAHELGHAWYQHVRGDKKAERQASVWAARRLIKAGAFIDALHQTQTAQGTAHILGVLPRDITTYISTLTPAETLLIRQIITPQREP